MCCFLFIELIFLMYLFSAADSSSLVMAILPFSLAVTFFVLSKVLNVADDADVGDLFTKDGLCVMLYLFCNK
jgi:hypothetical protein